MQYFDHVLYYEAQSATEAREIIASKCAELEAYYQRPKRNVTVVSHIPNNGPDKSREMCGSVVIRRFIDDDLAVFIYYQIVVKVSSKSPILFDEDEEEEEDTV